MKAIRIQNLKSLEDTGYVDLKPITVLIGQNSSGKSTFLRTFPLLRQSTEMRISGPILWYGQYVDFGDFTEAVRKPSLDNQIGLGFEFHIDEKFNRRIFVPPFFYKALLGRSRSETVEGSDRNVIPLDIKVELKIAWNSKTEMAYIKSYLFELFDHSIVFDFSSDGRAEKFKVNNKDFTSSVSGYRLVNRGGVMPHILNATEESSTLSGESHLENEIRKRIKNIVDKKTPNITIDKIFSGWIFGNSHQILESMQKSGELNESWKNEIIDWKIDSETFVEIKDLWVALLSRYLTLILEDYFRQLAPNLKYIAPVRAIAQRFYRVQNLDIDEPDFQGRNLPMYLRNLTEYERKSFSDWTDELFGFSILTESKFGHTSLYLKDTSSGEKNNLADTGFGYSQILPILVQLWSIVGKKPMYLRRSIPYVFITIEQPELHLHPKMQAQLTDAFVKVVNDANERGIELRLILETHSQTIVNRLGHLIMHKEINFEDINLIIFEKDEYSSPTRIRIGEYDSEGYLTNWPYGFFEPDEVK